MNKQMWSMTEMVKVVDYKIIEGFPSDVYKEVQELLAKDWQPNGEMYKINIHGNEVVVQCMILYQEARYN